MFLSAECSWQVMINSLLKSRILPWEFMTCQWKSMTFTTKHFLVSEHGLPLRVLTMTPESSLGRCSPSRLPAIRMPILMCFIMDNSSNLNPSGQWKSNDVLVNRSWLFIEAQWCYNEYEWKIVYNKRVDLLWSSVLSCFPRPFTQTISF